MEITSQKQRQDSKINVCTEAEAVTNPKGETQEVKGSERSGVAPYGRDTLINTSVVPFSEQALTLKYNQ